jgi:hypothetical protein
MAGTKPARDRTRLEAPCDPSLKAALKTAAKLNGESMSVALRMAATAYIATAVADASATTEAGPAEDRPQTHRYTETDRTGQPHDGADRAP